MTLNEFVLYEYRVDKANLIFVLYVRLDQIDSHIVPSPTSLLSVTGELFQADLGSNGEMKKKV